MSITKVHNVKRAQIQPGRCEACGKSLFSGQPYKWMQVARGAQKRIRCETCPTWTASQLESRPAVSDFYAALESGLSSLTDDLTLEEAQAITTGIAEGIMEAVNSLQDSISEMEETFPNSNQLEPMQELVSEMESFGGEVESLLEGIDVHDFDIEEVCNLVEGGFDIG